MKYSSRRDSSLRSHEEGSNYYAWSSAFGETRSIYHWKQPGVADAYSANVPAVYRREAQRKLHALATAYQRLVARLLRQDDRSYAPRIAVQLAPFYTSCPRQLCAWASLGLTVYLEYEAREADNLVRTMAKPFLASPAEVDGRYRDIVQRVDASCLKEALDEIAQVIERRLILDILRRQPRFGTSVEFYRVYAASILDRSFPTLADVVSAPILYGDLIPDWQALKPHPTALCMMRAVQRRSERYLGGLPNAKSEQLAKMGVEWLKEVGLAIAPYLPPPSVDEPGGGDVSGSSKPSTEHDAAIATPWRKPALLPPLGAPMPPMFIGRRDGKQGIPERLLFLSTGRQSDTSKLSPSAKPEGDAAAALERLGASLHAMSRPAFDWEDAMFEDVERRLATAPFSRSGIEGAPQEGHEVSMVLDGKTYSGNIHEQVVAPSAGDADVERLECEAAPLTRALRKLLYPSVEDRTVTETGLLAGRLDGRRLHRARCSERLFKRSRFVSTVNKTGGAVLLLLLDASGSIGFEEMRLTKLTAAAFYGATRGTQMKLMCAAYNEGRVDSTRTQGANIRWLYHPLLSLAGGDKREALRCLASVPDSGSGGQQDALSLSFCLTAARRLARQDNVYVVLMSDMGWCKSFSGAHTAQAEVREFFVSARADMGRKFHSTLVALSCSAASTALDDVVDSVIPVSGSELASYELVAEKLSKYVAECMRDRRRLGGTP